MKKATKILVAAMILGLGAGSAMGALLVHYTFDETGSTVNNLGTLGDATMYDASGNPTDLHTAGGAGVSPRLSDRALDLGGNTYGQNAPRVQASYTTTTVSSFTLSMWFNKDMLPGNNEYPRLFQYFTANANRLDLFYSAGDDNLNLKLATSTGSGNEDFVSSSFAGGLGEWVFFAATYDAGDPNNNNLRLYRATQNSPVSLLGTFNAGTHSFNYTAGTFTVGNNDGNQRGFDGQIDSLRFYDQALSLGQIEEVWFEDSNVPEPSTVGLAVLGILFLRMARGRGKRRQ